MKIKFLKLSYLFLFSFVLSCSNYHVDYGYDRYPANTESTEQLSKEELEKIRAEVEVIDGSELLDEGAQQLLYDEQVLHNKALWGYRGFDTPMDKKYWPENRPKFKLPYYLIPEEDSEYLQSKSIEGSTLSQISETIDGKKYYKLFVHPVSFKHYEFLQGHYKFIDSHMTEFTAAPTSSYRSLLVWNHEKKMKPFISKVTLDTTIIGKISRVVKRREVLRSLANQRAFDEIGRETLNEIGVDFYDESAGLNIGKDIPGAPEVLGGQLIREIPDKVIEGKARWASLSTVMSPEGSGKPLIMQMIEKSGMSSEEFFEKVFIDGYMDMFEQFSFVRGFNFEPHSQNLSMEIVDGVPSGNWVHRDFGGFWPDILKIIESGGPVEALMNEGHADDFYFRDARSNFANSYAFFYKRQVFDYVLREIKKYDKTITTKVEKRLNIKIGKRMLELIEKHLGYKTDIVPSMLNYHNQGLDYKKNIAFIKTEEMIEIENIEEDIEL